MGWLEIISLAIGVFGAIATSIQVRMWYRDWQKNRTDKFSAIERHGLELLNQIRRTGYRPDFVLGLGRSGAFLGGWLAGNLGSIRIEVIDRVHRQEAGKTIEFPEFESRLALLKSIYGDGAKVLVVEGATTRGSTFNEFEIARRSFTPSWRCCFCVLYEVDTNMFEIDFVGKSLPRAPESYPWHATEDYKKFIRRTKSLEA